MNIERTRIFLSRSFVNVTHSRDPQKEMQNINRKQTIGYVLNLEYTKKKDQQFSLSHSVYSKFFRKLFMLREKDCTKTLHALKLRVSTSQPFGWESFLVIFILVGFPPPLSTYHNIN